MEDVFIEHMVKQKKNGLDYAKIVGIILLYVLIVFVSLLFIQYIAFLFPLIIIGGIYGVYWFISSLNHEYEYIVTNGTLDIDRIIAKRRRKRVFTADARNFELCAPVNSDEYKDFMRQNEDNRDIKKLDASTRTEESEVWFIVATSQHDNERYIVLFEPDKQIMDNLYRFNPRNIHYNAMTTSLK